MPTNFPTGVDNFTNPTANDSLNIPSHSLQHSNANDAIEAVEDYLLNGAGKSGLVFLNRTDFVSAATASVDNVFNSTYTNYRFVLVGLTATQGACVMQFRFRTGAGNYTTSTYAWGRTAQFSTTVVGAGAYSTNLIELHGFTNTGTNIMSSSGDIFNPNATFQSTVQHHSSAPQTGSSLWLQSSGSGWDSSSTQFTGYSILLPALSTGALLTFGYRNS